MSRFERVLVSACLVGQRVRYNGSDALSAWPDVAVLERWTAEGRVVPYCAEVAAGFAVPRPPAEVRGEDGGTVLDGPGRVFEASGADVTDVFLRGAELALREAQRLKLRVAVLKDLSPSCGVHRLYTGHFDGTTRSGRGVTAGLLARHGIRVYGAQDAAEADLYLRSLDGAGSAGPGG